MTGVQTCALPIYPISNTFFLYSSGIIPNIIGVSIISLKLISLLRIYNKINVYRKYLYVVFKYSIMKIIEIQTIKGYMWNSLNRKPNIVG